MSTFYFSGVPEGTVQLDEEEAHHLSHVLRLKSGDAIRLMNGHGTVAAATVETVSKKGVWVTVGECRHFNPHVPALHICIAPTKNMERMEWFAEKATELGINSITPLVCRRSERRELRIDRLNKVVISAAKQSGQSWFPEIRPVQSFDALMDTPPAETGYIAWCGEGKKTDLRTAIEPQKSLMVLIGPEGDFTNEEIRLAIEKGFHLLSMGGARLRTETAAIAVVAAFRVFHPVG